jgi:multidrug resistance protein MdtO
MTAATDVLTPARAPDWLSWLRRELAPYPGRDLMTLRLVVGVVLVTIISMTLQIPEAALSAYMVFFVTKENRVLTAITGIGIVVGLTIAVAMSLYLYRYTFDYPELRIPLMAIMVFAGMYLSRVFVIGPLGFAIGFVVAVTQSAAESAPDTDALARALLWVWMAIAYPILLTVVINQILFPANPWPALVRALTQRLDAVSSVLQRLIDENTAGGHENEALLEIASRGSSQLLALLHMAEIKEERLKHRHAAIAAAILTTERVARAAAMLELTARQSVSENDRHCAGALLAKIARLRTALQEVHPVLPRRGPAEENATLPELRELQLAIESLHSGMAAAINAGDAPAPAKTKKPLFIADAFSNPAHARFALKVTLAAMSCYILYSGLDWSGIHTAFITCCIIALENTGATMRKGWLRLTGCLTGGLLGFLAIMYLIPHMESITSLVLLIAAVSAVAGWIAAGGERITYGGLQMAFAFFMCIFQGFAPGTDFDTIRDRIVGIVLGIFVSAIVFRYIWPEHAVDRLRLALAQAFRNLAKLLLVPETSESDDDRRKTAGTLAFEITKNLDQALRFSELAKFELADEPEPDSPSVSDLENATHQAEAASVIASTLAGDAEFIQWQRLDPPAREAEARLRAEIAKRINESAISFESGARPNILASATIDIASQPQIRETDRTRLLRLMAARAGKLWN